MVTIDIAFGNENELHISIVNDSVRNTSNLVMENSTSSQDGNTNIRDTAHLLNVSVHNLVNFLLSNGFFYRDENRKLRAYPKFVSKGLFADRTFNTNVFGIYSVFTPLGIEYIRSMLKNGKQL